jgi:hypothetical protein
MVRPLACSGRQGYAISSSSFNSRCIVNRSIPGFEQISESREFIYVEAVRGEDFDELVDAAIASCPDVPLPRSGGIGEERIRVRLPDGTMLLGMSYTRDLAGWRRKMVSFCEERHKRWATPRRRHRSLAVSDGTEVPLDACEVIFEP